MTLSYSKSSDRGAYRFKIGISGKAKSSGAARYLETHGEKSGRVGGRLLPEMLVM
jgi:hypothetical protein